MLEKDTLRSIIRDKNFELHYLEVLNGRFTSGSIQIETDDIYDEYNQALMYDNNLVALKYLLNKNEPLRIDIIHRIAKIIDEDKNDKGFRNTNINVLGSNIERARPNEIYQKMYSLLDCYYNIWSYNEDIIWKEAMFHLNFLLIHPYDDGNGRTARIITTANLLQQGILPGVITLKDKKEYCDIIERQDADALAELFKRLTIKEELIFATMYEHYIKYYTINNSHNVKEDELNSKRVRIIQRKS